ncbi:hypothetical protein Bcen2424_4441 [Burkholderia cenocepacia HI2424]|nr:hypothetical protein Bcen2424_4441 [Burkholderia cenocepacia HI2424]
MRMPLRSSVWVTLARTAYRRIPHRKSLQSIAHAAMRVLRATLRMALRTLLPQRRANFGPARASRVAAPSSWIAPDMRARIVHRYRLLKRTNDEYPKKVLFDRTANRVP